MEYAVPELGLHLRVNDPIGKREAPDEPPIRSLNSMDLTIVPLPLLLPFSLQREHSIVQSDPHIFSLDLGQLRLNVKLLVGFTDVHGRSPIRQGHYFPAV